MTKVKTLYRLAMCFVLSTLATRAGVLVDFRFEGDLSSYGGGPSLTDLGGSNGFTTDTVDGTPKTVFNFALGTGLSLDVATLPDKDSFTVAALFKFTTTSIFNGDDPNQFQRILQTKNFTSDEGFYWVLPATGVPTEHGTLIFYQLAGGVTGAHEVDRYEQVVMVNDHGMVSAFVDGALQFDNIAANASVSPANLMQFFRDDVSESSAGAVARLRVFDTALTPVEAAGLDRLPAAIPEPSCGALLFGLGVVGWALCQCRRQV